MCIQISLCVRRPVLPIQSCSFSRLDRQRSRCPRRLCLCQRVLVFGIVLQLLVSRQDTVLYQWNASVVRSLSGPKVMFFRKIQSVLGINTTVSCKQICVQLHLPSSELDSFLPSNTNMSCNTSRGVPTVFVFALHPDSLIRRCPCLRSSSCTSVVQFDLFPLRGRYASEPSSPNVPLYFAVYLICAVSQCD